MYENGEILHHAKTPHYMVININLVRGLSFVTSKVIITRFIKENRAHLYRG